MSPTEALVAAPTDVPTAKITPSPTNAPVAAPTDEPAPKVTGSPTKTPVAAPTDEPTAKVTQSPTKAPIKAPVSTVVVAEPVDSSTAPSTVSLPAETEAPTQAPESKTNSPTSAKATTSVPMTVETPVVVEPQTDSPVLLPEDTAFTDFMSMSMSMSMPMTLDGYFEELATMEFSSWKALRGGNEKSVQGRFSEGGRREKIRFRDDGDERFGLVGSR